MARPAHVSRKAPLLRLCHRFAMNECRSGPGAHSHRSSAQQREPSRDGQSDHQTMMVKHAEPMSPGAQGNGTRPLNLLPDGSRLNFGKTTQLSRQGSLVEVNPHYEPTP